MFNFRQKLEETCKFAHDFQKSQARYKYYYDKKAKDKFNVGNKVLLLLPSIHNMLLLWWRDPYLVVEQKGYMDYIIYISGRNKIFYLNMLKYYVFRSSDGEDVAAVCSVTLIESKENAQHDPQNIVVLNLPPERKWQDIIVNHDLTSSQLHEIRL